MSGTVTSEMSARRGDIVTRSTIVTATCARFWSDRVATILGEFSPIVEMASVDEAYLDLSGTERLHGPPLAAADKLLRTITTCTGLPCSGGLATTRLVAKVASDQGKPRGLVWVAPGMEARFLAPLPIRKIPGIGEVTEEHEVGVAGNHTEAHVRQRVRDAIAFGDEHRDAAEGVVGVPERGPGGGLSQTR